MNIDVYIVHIYQNGKYERTVETPMTERSARQYEQVFNEINGSNLRAVVQAVSISVTPPAACLAGSQAVE